MAEIKASDVKALREKTGAGMMDCKNALEKTAGDFAKAEKTLKEMGLAAMEKRVDRATNEGKIFVKVSGSKAIIAELTCETDFVARNEDFVKLGQEIVQIALDKNIGTVTDELSAKVADLASKIRENMTLRRLTLIQAGNDEYLHEYLHGDKIGVIVRAKAGKASAFAEESVKTFVHDIALHIAAFCPAFLDRSKVSADFLKEQEEIYLKQMEKDEKMKGKPANVLQGIIKGKMNKYLSDICLLDQGFVKDEKQTVSAVMAAVAKDAGTTLEIADYVYYKVGA
jgi:elongation factor Ts